MPLMSMVPGQLFEENGSVGIRIDTICAGHQRLIYKMRVYYEILFPNSKEAARDDPGQPPCFLKPSEETADYFI